MDDELPTYDVQERTGPLAYVWTYGYGPTGNLTSQTTSRGGFVEETRLYECDANDRLTTETVTDSGGPREIVYACDADGNMVSKNDPAPGAGLIEYEWDSRDRLIGQTGGPDGPVSFLYDSDGNRVEKTVGVGGTEKTTRLLIDAANGTGYTQVRRERVATGGAPFLETARYVIGDDVLAQVRSDHPDSSGVPTLSQYHYDGLGTTRALSAPDGDATDATSYYGFGETLASAGDTPNTLLFTGEQYDPNLGFYHLRARYYDPAGGRFASLDPFAGDPESPMSLHKYLYAHAGPHSHVDPSGKAILVAELNTVNKELLRMATRALTYATAVVTALYQASNQLPLVHTTDATIARIADRYSPNGAFRPRGSRNAPMYFSQAVSLSALIFTYIAFPLSDVFTSSSQSGINAFLADLRSMGAIPPSYHIPDEDTKPSNIPVWIVSGRKGTLTGASYGGGIEVQSDSLRIGSISLPFRIPFLADQVHTIDDEKVERHQYSVLAPFGGN